MRFATFLYQTAAAEVTAVAQRAEALGFESLWIPDHLVMPVEYRSTYPYADSGRMLSAPDTPYPDAMLTLAFVAAATRAIRLATGILIVPLRNPFATAKAVATLDTLSGGRFIFGVGIGWLEEEFQAVGAEFADRARRTREYLALMKELWTRGEPVFHGRTVSAEKIRFMPKPLQKPHPPFVLGGDAEPSLRRAAQLGDGWYGIARSMDAARDVVGRLRGWEQRVGRTHPLEITLNPRFGAPLGRDEVARLAEIGVDRLILSAGRQTHEVLPALERFRDEVMGRVETA